VVARRNSVKPVCLLVAGGILSLLIPASVLAASYSVTSLKGSYGFSGAKAGIITEGPIHLDCSLNGTVGNNTLSGNATCDQVPAPGTTVANSATHGDYTGVMTFDGNGGLAMSGTMSENGVVSSLSGSGTYTVNADGTGTLGVSGTFSASFVIVSGGNEVLFSRTTSGKGPQLGVAIKQ
jgi:hypothetical protein